MTSLVAATPATPLPASASCCVPALVDTLNVALRAPVVAGMNTACTVQLSPPASTTPAAQLPLRANSPGFAPPAAIVAIVNGDPPPLRTVATAAVLALPACTSPKSRIVGASCRIATGGGASVAVAVTGKP